MRKWGRIIWGVIGLGVIAMAADAFWFEPRSTVVSEFDVEVPAWPKDTAPLRVVLLSDIHVDDVHMPPERVRKIAEQVAGLKPDVILLAGDYIGGDVFKGRKEFGARPMRSPEMIALDEEGLRALDSFKAPLGTYAVMGNHDCWWDCDRVREIFAETQVTFLENRAFRIERPSGDVWILGVEDGQTQNPDFPATAAQAPAGAATLTLTHNPGLFDWESNHAPIQLSGHSHAGQVRLPLIGAPVRVVRHTEDTADGYEVINGRILIVTRGLGSSGIPVRFGAPPQIMLLNIRPGTEAHVRPHQP
ncbi:calcineurin-like phosphoesterase family protein [Asticcacaulis biprosthecium C19]|uniref:Calcineurin-like phosphoesterase family protein n=1 Tax=Asticcacaulis biprosthecium C19 TaxID=715226 RepID=F4QJ97_9CAUL|nr:metallophosphoesterase [Asticcacaulis biprosthecium]EGF91928.1 calcineurin-like phosphoesterase family protein [Asticcacaulis biprosthecium C19]